MTRLSKSAAVGALLALSLPGVARLDDGEAARNLKEAIREYVTVVPGNADAQRMVLRSTGKPLTIGADAAKRMDLDLKDQPIRDALKIILGPLKREFEVADDVPKDVRVTVKASNVRLSTALDLLAEAAGAGWQTELKDGKVLYRLGKSIASSGLGSLLQSFVTLDLPEVARLYSTPSREGLLWRAYTGAEERASIACPHCKAQITRVVKRSVPKCPKCGLAFEPSWKVCPMDGTKRPETGAAWKYCPECGKTLRDAKVEE
jgi:hypothetical protein